MAQHRVVIFDLHGVLINSLEMGQQYSLKIAELLERDYHLPLSEGLSRHKASFKYWINEVRSWDALNGNTLSHRIDETIRHWAEILVGDREHDSAALQAYGEYLEYQAAARIHALYPEVIPVLETLRAAHPGIRLYVASSAHTRHVRGILEANDLCSRVDGFFGLDSFMCLKSDPRYFESLARFLECQPCSCVFVGNSTSEIMLSQEAGFIPVLVQRERDVSQAAIQAASLVLTALDGLASFLSR